MNIQVRTVNDVMIKVAEAMESRNVSMIDDIRRVVEGWLQGEEEMKAQMQMLDSAEEVLFELQELEGFQY